MKTCPNCNLNLPDDTAVCPNCGAALEAPAQEAPVQETPVPETPETAAPEAPAEKAAGKSRRNVILGVIGGVVVLACIVAAVILGTRSKEPAAPESVAEAQETPEDSAEPAEESSPSAFESASAHHSNAYGYPSFSIHFETAEDGANGFSYLNEAGETVPVEESQVAALMEQTVAACGSMTLDNRTLQYYYDQEFYNFYSAYSSYISYFMDGSLALDEQLSLDGERTWQVCFLESAIESFQTVSALYQESQAAGFTLDPNAQAYLDGMEDDLNDFAVQYGFADAQAYLIDYYGPYATVESYMDYIRMYQTAVAYYNAMAEALEISDADVEAYYDENAEAIQANYYVEKIDKNVVNIRHILITPADTESEDSWTEAEAEAQRIYDEWQNGEATEARFAELANANSTDPGSNTNGGLYENVYPGQMVTEFNDWCFADGRAVGDTAIVKTSYGYHIMYFSGEGDYVYWRALAEDLCRSERAAQLRTDAVARYDTAEDISKAILLDSTVQTVPTPAEEQ